MALLERLHRDLSAQSRLLAEADDTHPAFAEHFLADLHVGRTDDVRRGSPEDHGDGGTRGRGDEGLARRVDQGRGVGDRFGRPGEGLLFASGQ